MFRVWWRVTVISAHHRQVQILFFSIAYDVMKWEPTTNSVASPRFRREGKVLTTIVKYTQEVSYT